MKRQVIQAVAVLPFLCIPCASPSAQTSSQNVGTFEGQADVGSLKSPGSASYHPSDSTYTLTAAGENMWMRNDAFHFVWKKVSGDFFLSAKISFPHPGQNPHRKAVLILRQGLDSDAVYADVALHGSGLTALQYRGAKGDVTGDIELNFTGLADAPGTLGIEKRGDYLSMYVSLHGEPLHPSGASTIIHLDGEYYIGLGVCSHNKDVSETAVFSDVKLEPMTGLTVEKPDFLSTLQTISVDSSARRATEVYTAAGQFEAPNWTRDGKSLIFDRGGKIMSIPAAGVDPLTTQPTQIDTGSAINCNGSHGLSPDGKWLAISCSPPGGWASQVYIVPASGGTPRLVTQTPYSFFHSWSPDGKTIAFTRPHEGGGDIFSISVDGGKETRLTTSTGISDDPDYSPDGRYIYFNSDRAGGSMQIWRMHADGSNPEQITNDERNNWTPHLSPDGRSFVFLSYEKNVTGHPANKEISLRLMNLGDRQIRTLVNLVGGTGTINVPSWAPDGKSLAFVSYELVNPSPK